MFKVMQSECIFSVKSWLNPCHAGRLSMLIYINSQALTAKRKKGLCLHYLTSTYGSV